MRVQISVLRSVSPLTFKDYAMENGMIHGSVGPLFETVVMVIVSSG